MRNLMNSQLDLWTMLGVFATVAGIVITLLLLFVKGISL
jgi:hypothetical protein